MFLLEEIKSIFEVLKWLCLIVEREWLEGGCTEKL